MSEDKPRILIAEDDADARSILANAFGCWGYPLLVAADGDEALRLAENQPVDVALLDVVMPGLSGLELTECLRKIDPNIQIVVMTAYSTTEDAITARECGAVRYLPKPCAPTQVKRVVDSVWGAYLICCQEWLGDVCVDWRQQVVVVGGRSCSLCTLSRRERAVLDELVQGKTDAQIAEALEIGRPTVRTHLRHVTHKLKLNREQLLILWDRRRQRNRWDRKG